MLSLKDQRPNKLGKLGQTGVKVKANAKGFYGTKPHVCKTSNTNKKD